MDELKQLLNLTLYNDEVQCYNGQRFLLSDSENIGPLWQWWKYIRKLKNNY